MFVELSDPECRRASTDRCGILVESRYEIDFELRRSDMVPLLRSSMIRSWPVLPIFRSYGARTSNGQPLPIHLQAIQIAERGECDLFGSKKFACDVTNIVERNRVDISKRFLKRDLPAVEHFRLRERC